MTIHRYFLVAALTLVLSTAARAGIIAVSGVFAVRRRKARQLSNQSVAPETKPLAQ
jgi:hypothetical protein